MNTPILGGWVPTAGLALPAGVLPLIEARNARFLAAAERRVPPDVLRAAFRGRLPDSPVQGRSQGRLSNSAARSRELARRAPAPPKPKPKPAPRELSVAIHEAAHMTLAEWAGVAAVGELLPSGDGVCRLDPDQLERRDRTTLAAIGVAGAVADSLSAGDDRPWRECLSRGANGDQQFLAGLDSRTVSAGYRLARRVLQERAVRLFSLAEELLETGEAAILLDEPRGPRLTAEQREAALARMTRDASRIR